MRHHFDEQLERLHVELITMGALCEEAISVSVKALLETSAPLARKTSHIEEEIDQKEHEIETLCLRLLLQQQPVARDLREISSALKMISDMERIGDQAADIAEIASFMEGGNAQSQVHIKDMAEAAIKMVIDSVESFVKKDLELARAVMKYDDVVDGLFLRVRRELVELVAADGGNGEVYLDLLMIAKYLERIGDHAVNVAEWVEYSLTGVHRSDAVLREPDEPEPSSV